MLDVITRTNLIEKIGENNIYAESGVALFNIHRSIHDKGDCVSCPLKICKPLEEMSVS